MDPLRIAVRALAVYLFLLVLLRISGKQTVRQSTGFDFLLVLIMGDLVDDAIWGEVPLSQFVTAAGTLALAKLVTTASRAAPNPPWREFGVAACVAVALASLGTTIAAGDRRTVVPGPDIVAAQLTRQVVADRPAQAVSLLSVAGRSAYPPAALSRWGQSLEHTAGGIVEINGAHGRIDGDRATAVVIVRGDRRTLQLPFALIREYGTWRVERAPTDR
jgi:hypothetical protein